MSLEKISEFVLLSALLLLSDEVLFASRQDAVQLQAGAVLYQRWITSSMLHA
jgi:hypothetical protein